jgi:FAD:protein FMN transferase
VYPAAASRPEKVLQLKIKEIFSKSQRNSEMHMVYKTDLEKGMDLDKRSAISLVLSVVRSIIRALPLIGVNKKALFRRILPALAGFFVALSVPATASETRAGEAEKMQPGVVSGYTMSTVYAIVLPGAGEEKVLQIRAKILDFLEKINLELSVFEPLSQISRFNELTAGRSLCVSPGFQEVMRIARKAYILSDRSFDPTAAPLIDLWGFGEDGFTWQKPGQQEIEAAMELVGLDLVHMDESGCLSKTKDGIRLNLSAVAKGYAVDEIVGLLEDLGHESFLVSIGGDTRVRGPKPDGSSWRIGINRPLPGAGLKDTVEEFEMNRGAVATSGNYRNYFRTEDGEFGHIIDPATGYPAVYGTVSATVIADSCVLADAMATALVAMESSQALQMINSMDNVETLIIQLTPEGEYILHKSKGF